MSLQVHNFTDNPFTLRKGFHVANFSVLNPEQMKHIRPVDPTPIRHFLETNPENAIQYINGLFKTPKTDNTETYWFPTPENPGNESEHTPIQKRILSELRNLKELEKLNPLENEQSRIDFLKNFDWKTSTLSQKDKERIEELLVDFHDIFARHRFDIGINEDFMVKLTPKDESPAYSQSLPTPINLKEDILVELALLHKYGIITFFL